MALHSALLLHRFLHLCRSAPVWRKKINFSRAFVLQTEFSPTLIHWPADGKIVIIGGSALLVLVALVTVFWGAASNALVRIVVATATFVVIVGGFVAE